jgi:hypothetical protein
MLKNLTEKKTQSPTGSERRISERRQSERRIGERFAHEGWLFGGGTNRRSGKDRRSSVERRRGWKDAGLALDD